MNRSALKAIEQNPSTPKTQLVMVTGLLVLAWFFGNMVLVYIAGIVALLSFVPVAGSAMVWLWYKLAEILGWINSRILLSLIYFLIVTPIGFFYRLAGNDPLLLKDKKGSMYQIRDHEYAKADLENPW